MPDMLLKFSVIFTYENPVNFGAPDAGANLLGDGVLKSRIR